MKCAKLVGLTALLVLAFVLLCINCSDNDDKVYISYYELADYYKGSLKYATNASGEWVITTIKPLKKVERYE